MTLDSLYWQGIYRVWEEDKTSQTVFLEAVAKLRGMDVSVFKDTNAFFVPNDRYMEEFFGRQIKEEEFGCYSGDVCNWNNCLIVPVCNVAGKVAGFASFNPFKYAEAHETGDWTIHYYAYSPSSVFRKNRFLYMPERYYSNVLDSGYVVLVDGVFDAISLWAAGFHSAALMGSSISREILALLRFVGRVIFIMDNDEAGYKVFGELRKHLNNVELFKQGYAKDADELLKGVCKEKFIKQLRHMVTARQCPITLASF